MANIYVRKSGSNSNDGSTPALAKLTIASAISAMASGDTIYIGSGVYREQNLTTGSKNVTIIGDTTGEYTGDAGEVIWSGTNLNDEFKISDKAISSNSGYNIAIKNIILEHWGFANDKSLLYKNGTGDFLLENIKINSVYGINASLLKVIDIKLTSGTATFKNVFINSSKAIQYDGATIYGCYLDITSSATLDIDNFKIAEISAGCGSNQSRAYAFYLNCDNHLNININNIDIDGFFSFGGTSSYAYGMYLKSTDYLNTNNVSVQNGKGIAQSSINLYGIYTNYSNPGGYHYSPSVNNVSSNKYENALATVTNSNEVNKANYIIPKIPTISKYSPLRGQGYTSFPTTDIEGNPRPAYGNGTACDIGASEATSDTIQKESTIKDSGDYSIKVSPCNYFKKTFQVPVTASTLRTVKVKIRIDGTWGTYLPRVSLSGQGMTLSQATKNATTGSFEELTVSGTPTTTGIALLTIEAHSPNTDAAFYIDTITIE